MSLLMKALEKAAKDRGEARVEAPAAATGAEARPELSLALELLAADTPSPRLRDDGRPETAGRTAAPAANYRSSDIPRPAPSMRAGPDTERSTGAYLRDHPLIVFGIFAGLFAIGFGSYVYIQIFYPGLLIRQQPPVPAPIGQPAPAPPQPVQPIATATVLQRVGSAGTPVNESPPAQSAAPAQLAVTPPAEPAPAAPPPKPVAVRPAGNAEAPAPRDAIVVKKGDAGPAVNPALVDAYASLQAGSLASASQLYAQVLRSEPRNVDALLGLAAIALRENRNDDAAAHYRAILNADPRHALAQSGLIALTGRADPVTAESHLKQLIAREPSAYLYFLLGNLYADQSLWAPAQQAYFQAHHLEPDNPDYAYNLAVALEHIGQPRLALGFYRRAVELATARRHVNFDPARARDRVTALAARVE